MGAVDEYLATLHGAARSAYERVRDVALAEVPGAEQGISYGMATLKYRGKPLLGFRVAKDHLSVFPFSPAAVEAVKEQLPGDAVSKGTVRFSADQPLPDSIVLGLVRIPVRARGGLGIRRNDIRPGRGQEGDDPDPRPRNGLVARETDERSSRAVTA